MQSQNVIEDQEQLILDTGLLSQYQIQQMKLFFAIIVEDKDYFEYEDFCKIIQSLLNDINLDKQVMLEFFLMFDKNGDQKLDWYEYLVLFCQWAQSYEYLKIGRYQQTTEAKRKYLILLQLEFLTSPFNGHTPNFIQRQLINLEIESMHNKKIGPFYYLALQTLYEIGEDINERSFQYLNQLLVQPDMALKEIVDGFAYYFQFRAPHQLPYSQGPILKLFNVVINPQFFEEILKHSLSEQPHLRLYTFQIATFVVHCYKLFPQEMQLHKNQIPIIINLFHLALKYFRHPDDTLVCQLYIFAGICIGTFPEVQIDSFNYKDMILSARLMNQQAFLYHSWMICNLFGINDKDQLNSLLKNLKSNKVQWLQDIEYYIISPNNIKAIQSQITQYLLVNYGFILGMCLSMQHSSTHLCNFLLTNLQSQDHYVQHEMLNAVKRIFQAPSVLGSSNSIIYLLSNHLISLVLNLTNSTILSVKEKALSVFSKYLCQQNTQLIIRYYDEIKNYLVLAADMQNLLLSIKDEEFQAGAGYYRQMIIFTIIILTDNSPALFQEFSKYDIMVQFIKQILFKSHSINLSILKQLQSSILSRPPIFDLQEVFFSYQSIKMFYQQYNKHFEQVIFQESQNKSIKENIELFELMLASPEIQPQLAQYIIELVQKQKFQPTLLRQYIRTTMSYVTDIFIDQLTFYEKLRKNFQQNTVPISQKLLLLIRTLQESYSAILSLKEPVEDLLALSGENNNVNYVTVYLNQYKSQTQCKVLIKDSLDLLGFEKLVEENLQISTPLIYLFINQSSPDKQPYEPTISDDFHFKQFKLFCEKSVPSNLGMVKIPQEIIALDIFMLKRENCSMRKISEIFWNGQKLNELYKIKESQLLWYLENSNSNVSSRGQLINSLHLETKLDFYLLENLYDSIVNFLNNPDQNIVQISNDVFVDFLANNGIPYKLGKRIATFLSKSGPNNPIDFTDLAHFVSVFIQTQSETILLKMVYMLYINENGKFGINELTNYLSDLFDITKVQQQDNAKLWALELLQKTDKNKDGFLSFYEYHQLLCDQTYRENLLDPVKRTLQSLTQIQQTYQSLPRALNSPYRPLIKSAQRTPMRYN
ncbi:hypothetical protein pb186bvf_001646 [Paramecium bursaria]